MENKEIFQISADFELDVKPAWINDFRSKYDKPYSYHITLKNSTYFNPKNLNDIKKDLTEITENFSRIKVVFDKLFLSKSPKGECVMIEAIPNKELSNLQKLISERLSKFGKHIYPEYKEYENEFRPHITIARYLDSEQMERAKNDLGKDMHCEATINKLVLTVAKEDTYEEWSNPDNEFIVKLK